MPRTMRDFAGNTCIVSEEVYRLKVDKTDTFGHQYRRGAMVRLIGGVDGHFDKPGYHFNPRYVTVTYVNAKPAHLCGVKRSELELITDKNWSSF